MGLIPRRAGLYFWCLRQPTQCMVRPSRIEYEQDPKNEGLTPPMMTPPMTPPTTDLVCTVQGAMGHDVSAEEVRGYTGHRRR